MRVEWDKTGERLFETGVDQGMIYPADTYGVYQKGTCWNGLTAVNESPSGGEANDIYADNDKYLSLMSVEKFGATIEAYTYPDEFADCDGTKKLAPGLRVGQQVRKMFGFSYRTKIGDDVVDAERGYKYHIVYGCKASPSSQNNQTVNESPEAKTFSWEINTTPVKSSIPGVKPTAHVWFSTIDEGVTDAMIQKIEDILYGTETTEPRMPSLEELVEILTGAANIVTIGITAESPSANLLGMYVSDLQENIVISDSAITGTLKAVTGYTGFSSDTSMQDGHYLAFKVTEPATYDSAVVEVINGTSGPVTLDSDKNIVLYIVDKDTQKVKVTITVDGEETVKVYDLSGLVLEA